MLDPKRFEEGFDQLRDQLKVRNVDSAVLSTISELSSKRKSLIQQVEVLKAERNAVSKEIGALKAKAKSDPAIAAEADRKVVEMREVGDRIKALDEQLRETEERLSDQALRIPNVAHESVPVGSDESANQEVRRWGDPAKLAFTPKDHVELGESLGILDFERATKLSGARFSVYQGPGATLERALIQFMLDLHTREHGYTEVIPPFLVNPKAMLGTGQLPKFEKDLFKTGVEEDERPLYLIPTAEVPLTNLHGGEILEASDLPKYLTAYTPCFRSEAGSHGRDTRGLIRQHQFQKVELVKLSRPEDSFEELEKMTANAEKVLQLLGLSYRVVLLCTGDMGFGATKTYDIEVWLPAQNTYREISSCSNCADFQARRAGIRFRPEAQAKPQFVHTLNGSGLAVGRTFVAILENYQDETGQVKIPQVLNRYLDGAPGFEKRGDDLWMVGLKKR